MGKRESAGPFLLVFLHKRIEHGASPAGKVSLASAVEEQPAGGEQGALSLRQGWALSPEAVDRHRALSLPPPPDWPLGVHPTQLLGAQGMGSSAHSALQTEEVAAGEGEGYPREGQIWGKGGFLRGLFPWVTSQE